MEKNKITITLTVDEFTNIQLALEWAIEGLQNRFTDDERYIHPAKKYQELLDKLNEIPF